MNSVGITGVLKFSWDCGGIQREAMAFWLVMIKREVFDKIGVLDEVFSPGMGEDGDFCIRAVEAGYEQVSVPQDVTGEFDVGIKNFGFPIFHKGNGTFADEDVIKNEVIQRNIKILEQRYGMQEKINVSIIIPTAHNFENALKPCLQAVYEYTDLSDKEIIVVANGAPPEARLYLNELSLMSPRFKYLWFDQPTGVVVAYNAGIVASRGKRFVLLDDDSFLLPQERDDWIKILSKPFLEQTDVGATGPFAHHYEDLGFCLHSGCAMYDAELIKTRVGGFDEAFNPGYFCDPDMSLRIWEAGYRCVEVPVDRSDKPYDSNQSVFVVQFPVAHMGTVQTMDKNKDIELVKKNRELLYSRHVRQFTRNEKMKEKPKYSVVIPTYNHCEDLLKPCLESIKRFTDLSNVEVIVVANGCTDNTREYVESLGEPFKLVWIDEPSGYTKSTNVGIRASVGEYVVLLNNDTELLPQPTNQWLNMLEAPFSKQLVGLAGPLELYDEYAGAPVLIFFCVMIKREVFDKIGLLDEIYSPGGGEDIDFTIRARLAGYEAACVTPTVYVPSLNTNSGGVPIWHKDNGTFKAIPEYTNHIVKRNGLINAQKYNRHMKLNLGAGGIEVKGYLSVDFYDPRAHVHMDITKLDFPPNSADEILASHVFEHLNPYHSVATLAAWRQVLRVGGKLIMEMPDIEQLCKRFVTASTGERYGILNAIYGSVNTTDTDDPSKITSPHLFGWWPQSLNDHLMNAGYAYIEFMPEQIPHPESNLRVEAINPLPNRAWLKEHDSFLFGETFEQNLYGMTDRNVRGKTVLDLGANIGYFTLFAIEHGAKKVIAVEAQSSVFYEGLIPLTQPYRDQVVPVHQALYSEDGLTVYLENEHVASRIGPTGAPVETVTLSTLVDRYPEASVMKIDIEGAEYDVLLTTDNEVLRRFEVIFIEIHGDANLNSAYRGVSLIEDRLARAGFSMEGSARMTGDVSVINEKWVRV